MLDTGGWGRGVMGELTIVECLESLGIVGKYGWRNWLTIVNNSLVPRGKYSLLNWSSRLYC